jgi:hypothetical protein
LLLLRLGRLLLLEIGKPALLVRWRLLLLILSLLIKVGQTSLLTLLGRLLLVEIGKPSLLL